MDARHSEPQPAPDMSAPLPGEFFARSPVLVAPDLLGCLVVSSVGGELTGGIIVETEAYLGVGDPGSHASTRGITARNAVMYGPPGTAYVYFTYGNHFMLNLVCEPEGTAGGVLIRALRPTLGTEVMTSRRHGRTLRELCSGPGKLCAALGIDLSDNGVALGRGRIEVYDRSQEAQPGIAISGRIGLTQGHDLPLRYFFAGDAFVSRGRTGPMAPKRRAAGPPRGSE